MPTRSSTAQDVFTHLLSIVMLYVTIWSTLVVLFSLIEQFFPDPLILYPGPGADLDAIRTAAAAMIIAFPVFLLASWILLRGIKAFPEKADLSVRRWLLSLTLFFAAVTIIIDLIVLIHSFLNGDLTTRFVFKVLAVLLVAIAVFGYEFWDLRRKDFIATRMPRLAAWASSVILLVILIAGLVIAGSPFHQRLVRFDTQRVSDLQSIQSSIVDFWTSKQRLPATLDNLRNDISGFSAPIDPETHAPYTFSVVTPHSFRLCATFETTDSGSSLSVPRPMGGIGDTWQHGIGNVCFQRTIDPAFYKK